VSDTVISVQNLSKRYRLGVIGTGTFYGDLKRWWAEQRGNPDPYQIVDENDHGNRDGGTIWALKDINISVNQGEILGIIGRNGAGKSTLLKILSQVVAPTSGAVKVKGKIASLLEVGTGFHPELTGRENIFLNGAILGMTKAEVLSKQDEIIDFSGVEAFIDTPVKRYSSGMYVRLAFAVAAHLEPDIMVVDEVLAVGDAHFQKKCLGKMKDVAGEGRTVLYVSHNMQSIEQLCSRCVLLNSGRIEADTADVRGLVDKYIKTSTGDIDACVWENPGSEFDNPWFKPLRFYVSDRDGNVAMMPARNDDDLWLRIDGQIIKPNPSLIVGYYLYDDHNRLIYSSWSIDSHERKWPIFKSGRCSVVTKLPKRLVNEGSYRLNLSIQIRPSSSGQINIIEEDNPISIAYTIIGGLSDSSIWTKRRAGILAPVIEWDIITNEETYGVA